MKNVPSSTDQKITTRGDPSPNKSLVIANYNVFVPLYAIQNGGWIDGHQPCPPMSFNFYATFCRQEINFITLISGGG